MQSQTAHIMQHPMFPSEIGGHLAFYFCHEHSDGAWSATEDWLVQKSFHIADPNNPGLSRGCFRASYLPWRGLITYGKVSIALVEIRTPYVESCGLLAVKHMRIIRKLPRATLFQAVSDLCEVEGGIEWLAHQARWVEQISDNLREIFPRAVVPTVFQGLVYKLLELPEDFPVYPANLQFESASTTFGKEVCTAKAVPENSQQLAA